MAKISQREARRLKKRVEELEREEAHRRRVWASEYPHGVNIATAKWEEGGRVPTAILTARKLKHAVVCTAEESGRVLFFALPLAK